MAVRRLTVSGRAPADLVWERYARPALWTSWSPQIRGVGVDAERIAPGVCGLVRGPLGLGVRFEIVAVDEAARTWSWRIALRLATLDLHHSVTKTENGSTTTLTIDGSVPLVLGYLVPARLALGRLVAAP
ncbi:MAG: SRPBCC family protein [Actinomycetota bacterium]|nr:SRPBCC family protein [Actinomycetota bacterium]